VTPSPDADEVLPVEVQTRFERFPASIRGAFVLRGADGNPHSVRLRWARMVRLPLGPDRPIPVEDRLIDVAPSRDLFVPFEAPVMDLEPAWYAVESSFQVDAGRSYEFRSRLFTIPWPRNDVRRGSIVLGGRVKIGEREFILERVDLTSECSIVSWRAGDPEADRDAGPRAGPRPGPQSGPGHAVLISDGTPLEGLPVEAGGRTAGTRTPGEMRTVTYPVPRHCRSLQVLIEAPSGRRSEPLRIRLP
jgi:hypothetical protein